MASASASASASALPYPPLRPHSTPDNHGASITVAAAFCMTLMLLCLFIRVSVRWPLQKLFKYDDWTTVAASIFATIQTIITLVAVHDGLGIKATPNSNVREQVVLRLIYTGSLLFVVSLALGKLAVAFLCLRLSASEEQRRRCKILSILIAVWGFGSTIAIALRQDLRRPWRADSLFVYGTLTRWIVIEVLGAIFEICFILLIHFLLRESHMERSKKAIVLFPFCVRLPLIGIAAVRLVYIADAVSPRPRYVTFAATNPEILTQLEMHLNVLTATLPCLYAFLKTLESGNFGAVSTSDPYYSPGRSESHTIDSKVGTQDNGALRINVNQTFEMQSMQRTTTNSAPERVREHDAASDNSEHALYNLDDRIQRT